MAKLTSAHIKMSEVGMNKSEFVAYCNKYNIQVVNFGGIVEYSEYQYNRVRSGKKAYVKKTSSSLHEAWFVKSKDYKNGNLSKAETTQYLKDKAKYHEVESKGGKNSAGYKECMSLLG